MNLHDLSEFVDKNPNFSVLALILLIFLAGYALWILAVLVRGWEPRACDCGDYDDDDGEEDENAGEEENADELRRG